MAMACPELIMALNNLFPCSIILDNLLFNALLLIAAVVIAVYSFYHNRKFIPYLLALAVLSFLTVNFAWQISFLFILPLALPFFKELTYSEVISFCLFPAIVLANLMLKLFLQDSLTPPALAAIALLSLAAISALGILGLFENNLIKFLLISNIIQLVFVLADLTIAALVGKLQILGTIAIFNYTFTGLLLFITLGFLSKNSKQKNLSDMQGTFYSNKPIGTFATISAISLAGLPGLNIFVAEWYLFITAYSINPVYALLAIFAALILFVMYFKVPYTLLVGKGKARKAPIPLTITSGALALACLILGLLPSLQLILLGAR